VTRSQDKDMKLTNFFPQIATDNRVQTKKSKDAEAAKSTSSASTELVDRVEISSGSKDVQRMQQILQNTPDVRMERVEALRQQIGQGQYKVDPLDIAEKMLVSLVTENPMDQ